MTIAPASSAFERLTARPGDALAAAAKAAADQAAERAGAGPLIVVIHPERDDHQVLAADGIGVLRAAVSVAAASGHDRLWADAPSGDTIGRPVNALPEVVRAAAEASQIVATHTGIVRLADQLACVAIWFESGHGVEPAANRRHTLELLAAAAERDARRHADERPGDLSVSDRQTGSGSPDDPADTTRRQFDPTDPQLDALTGLANRACFEHALEQYESDHATLVVIDIDHFDEITGGGDSAVADRLLLEVADRLVAACRKKDLIARLGTDTFAVLFDDVDRATALMISKRLLATIGEPLADPAGPEAITATVALAHQFGLVDTDELFDSATGALESGKRTGRGRLFLGS